VSKTRNRCRLEESKHECVDLLGDTGVIERFADQTALRLEGVDAGNIECSRDIFRSTGEVDKLSVLLVGRVVDRNGQTPDVLVEVAWVVLTARLQWRDEPCQRRAVEDRGVTTETTEGGFLTRDSRPQNEQAAPVRRRLP
jgi:hypothetical protein